MAIFEIPLIAAPQDFGIVLAGRNYKFRFRFRNSDNPCWVLDIKDNNDNPLACGLALVPGWDLLAGLEYLDIGGALVVWTDTDAEDVPTFDNLGIRNKLYFVTP